MGCEVEALTAAGSGFRWKLGAVLQTAAQLLLPGSSLCKPFQPADEPRSRPTRVGIRVHDVYLLLLHCAKDAAGDNRLGPGLWRIIALKETP